MIISKYIKHDISYMKEEFRGEVWARDIKLVVLGIEMVFWAKWMNYIIQKECSIQSVDNSIHKMI